MKLNFILIIGFLHSLIKSEVFYNSGYLKKDSYQYIGSGAFYLNTSEFKNDRNVYLKFEITDGYFEKDFLYYGGYSSTPYQVNLEKTKDNYEKTTIIPKRTSGITEYAYFKIPIPEEQYLFISIPKYNSFRTRVKVSFESTLSVGEIVGIAIGCFIGFIIIAVAFFIYCKRRQMRTEEGFISKP